MARTISTAISTGVTLAPGDDPLTITPSGYVSGPDGIDGPSSQSWTITNQNKEEIHFNIALSSTVSLDRPGQTGIVTLTRKQSTVAIGGIDTVSDSESGKVLHVVIPGKLSRELVFEMKEK